MLRNILALPVVLALGAGVAAQDIIPVDGDVTYAGRYDIATQTFHPAGTEVDQASYQADPTVLFDNSAFNGSLTTGGGLIETTHYLDWGTANFGGSGAEITDIQIGYATNLLAPADVALRIRLYEGSTGFGTPGTVIGDYLIGGLPNSGSGNFEAFSIDVTLPATLSMNDGAFGWSYNADSPGTGPLLCGPPNPSGVEDAIDRYEESDESYLTTFFFGGTPFASEWLQLTGRANFTPPSAWELYGVKKKISLNGFGPGTPDSTATLNLTAGTIGKPVFLVVGVTQSDLQLPASGIRLYAFPWVFETSQFIPNTGSPTSLEFAIPSAPTVQPGFEFFFQAFGQSLAGEWVNYSKGVKLTIQ